MTAEIKLINQRKIIEKQQQDIKTYNLMVQKISDKLHNGEFGSLTDKTLGEEQNLYHAILKPGCQDFVKIFPFSLAEDSILRTVQIDVHNKKAFEYIQEILESYSDNYKHLEEITIRTYF